MEVEGIGGNREEKKGSRNGKEKKEKREGKERDGKAILILSRAIAYHCKFSWQRISKALSCVYPARPSVILARGGKEPGDGKRNKQDKREGNETTRKCEKQATKSRVVEKTWWKKLCRKENTHRVVFVEEGGSVSSSLTK